MPLRPLTKDATCILDRDAMTVIGSRVRRIRMNQGKSLQTVALAAGLSGKSDLSKRELGQVAWTEEDIRSVARVLRVSISELFGERHTQSQGA